MARTRLDAGGAFGRPRDGEGEPPPGAPAAEPVPGFAVGRLGRLAGVVAGASGVAAAPATGFGIPFLPGMVPVAPVGPAAPPPVDVAAPVVRPTLERPPFIPGIATLPTLPLPLPFPLPLPLPAISKTATQLATSAITQLRDANPTVVREALTTIATRSEDAAVPRRTLRPAGLLDYLERKVRVGEVLNQLASTWSESTVADFRSAFQMDAGKTDVMDAIVSTAILSNPELDEELLAENLPQPTANELLDNRVIFDQCPRGGTVMSPPYLILVAVEYRSIAQAEDVVRSITGDLVEFEGARLPRAVVERL